MPWENTEQYIRSGHRDVAEFQADTLKTITLSEKEGIKAIVGKPKGKHTLEVVSYLFEKGKGWTMEKAQEWFEKHHTPTKEHVYAVLPFAIAEKMLQKPLRICGIAMTAGMSRNFNIYTSEELQSFADKLAGAPVYIEHVTAENAVGKVTKTEWDRQRLWYNAEIYDEEVAEKIRKGLIRHVSIGADYETIEIIDGKVPHGLCNAEISLVAVPSIAETNIQILESLHTKEQSVEPIIAGEYVLGFYQDASAFMPEHFRAVWLDRDNGILAITGKLRQQPETERTMAIFFSKAKMWDQNKIQDWLALHPGYLASAQSRSAFAESLLKRATEPVIPVSEAVKMIEAVLPSPLVQRRDRRIYELANAIIEDALSDKEKVKALIKRLKL
ncbi:MAG: hypothetical protein NWF09_02145 [Candidatus Bathyarchaeota archaeon]|nr:hypothetical protein [Candidatus Bathyarchaeota archaeon]